MRVAAALLAATLHLFTRTTRTSQSPVTQPAKSPESVVALIKCAAPRLGVSTSKALYIGNRESHFEPWVCNSSDHCGVFQIYPPFWSYVTRRYCFGHLLGPLSRTNGRANVILSLRYMAHEGFSPWGM